uniref:Uncharacterized protein n=1 Tax=Myoviridae sp. ctnhb8 TaxID=2825171 RepID=A0A8S5VE48_9CAUD|nr:MAG TPA: hypothetical protein [Myoviridae sp. ctnhb8]
MVFLHHKIPHLWFTQYNSNCRFNHKSNGATLNHASGPWRDRMSAIRVSKFPLGCGELQSTETSRR